ncbi:MAG: hypothetical protein WBA22_07960 [Candidatus Methanofastidiosia archaeon]|jgi:hypothetical protein
MAIYDILPDRRKRQEKDMTLEPLPSIEYFPHDQSEFLSGSGPIDPEIQRELVSFFEILESVKDILDLGYRNDMCVLSQHIELREALDSLSSAFVGSFKEKDMQHALLDSARRNIINCAVETIKILAIETSSSVISRLSKMRFYQRLAFSSSLDAEKIKMHRKNMVYHLKRGQQTKNTNWKISIEEFKKAYDEAIRLDKDLSRRIESSYRRFGFLITLISLLIAVLSLLSSIG